MVSMIGGRDETSFRTATGALPLRPLQCSTPAKSRLRPSACVLHAIDWSQLPSNASLIQAVKQSADLLVKSASDKLGKAGLQAKTKVLEGHPRIAVAEYAKEWGADLVLVGSHGASGLVRFLLGSVAQAALRRSPCSVEIVRRPAQDSATASTPMKILIGTDGSDCSMAAVRSVAQRPWPPSSQIRVISVVPLIVPFGETISLSAAPVYPPPDLFDTIEKRARGGLKKL
jgi:nucleotide-binding universal stress UspA family protein